jgi:hypothetical protein
MSIKKFLKKRSHNYLCIKIRNRIIIQKINFNPHQLASFRVLEMLEKGENSLIV